MCYPTDEDLNRIEHWDPIDTTGLLQFIDGCWNKTMGVVRPHVEGIDFITGGWSGNESLISAFEQNIVAWSLCWLSSHRGGKHVFRVPELTED